ncbi:MAG: FGGY family carbohydrate kinase [Geminicoccaceae bacterium]
MAVTLGLDIGTTSTIGILIDTDGRTLALAERPVTLFSDQPGWAEEDPEQWWANAGAVCRELLQRSGITAHDIAGVGVTGMLPAVVLLDADGRPIRRSIQQSDGRVGAEVEALAREVDAGTFLARTGNGVNQQLVATKLRWLARHEPAAFARIATVLGSYDFIVHRLTGAWSLERNWALESGFYDLGRGDLAEDLVALGGIGKHQLPPVRDGHAVVGAVTAAAAAHTGLAEGTAVVAGCADHIASAFVAGVREAGDCLIKFGGAGDIMLATAEPRPDPRLFLDFHIVPGLFMPNGCMAASGAVLNWFVAELGGGRSHAELDRLAEASPPGARDLVALPYFLGEKTPLHDPTARGVLVGLGLHHRLGDIWRALLEAVVMGFRHHVEVARDIGYPVTRLLASDGGARSRVWMQIAADALQMPVHLLEGHPGSCLGAAYVAGVGVGAFAGWDGIGRFVRPAGVVEPRAEAAAAYDRLFARYRETYERLRPMLAAG